MKVLLLILSDADVEQLPAAARAISKLQPAYTWCLASPVILVDRAAALTQFDSEIADLDKMIEGAAAGRRFADADGYQKQRDGKMLDKAKAVRDAWKALDKETAGKRRTAIFKPFVDATHLGERIRISQLGDHHDESGYVALLNSMSGAWDQKMPHGDYAIFWPKQLAEFADGLGAKDVKQPAKESALPVVGRVASTKEVAPKTREEELKAMPYLRLKKEAKSAGIEVVKGMGMEKIRTEILEKESAVAV